MPEKNNIKVFYFFLGTTAELIRIAPIIKELRAQKGEYKLIFSGQTKILTEQVADYLGVIKPDIQFKEKIPEYSVVSFVIWMVFTFLQAIYTFGKEKYFVKKGSLYLIVYGDPVTTTIGAIVAKLYGIKIVHLESGDLSGHLLEPFPEEICRNINIRLADILFPPSQWALNNLSIINKPKINTHYNTLADTFWWFMKRMPMIRNELAYTKYYVLIMHRQEHVVFGKREARNTLKYVIENGGKNITCVLFNHPLTVNIIKSLKLEDKNAGKKIIVIPPVSYSEFLSIISNAEYIVTDGATNQFEAYLLGKPCLLLRNYTEQIEGLNKNIILSKGNRRVIIKFIHNYKRYRFRKTKPTISPSKIIVNYLLNN
jgi:UDP-N-acetylglucosamine 2-epimerase (non-hydrolysing)